MKPTIFLGTITPILFVKIINGQHNGFYNEQLEPNNPVSLQQQLHTFSLGNGVKDIVEQKGNLAVIPNNGNQHQLLMQTSIPQLPPNTQQIQLPPDLQQQPLQVQQFLELEKPLQVQQSHLLEQILKLQSQLQMQPLLQSQNPSPIETTILPTQSQDIFQLQPQIPVPPLSQSYQPVQSLQPLQMQQPLQSHQEIQIPQSLKLQRTFQSLEPLQAPQPTQLQNLLGFQQNSPLKPLTLFESNNLAETPVTQQKNSNQPNSQINFKWKSSNPQAIINVENPHNIQNLNNQLQQISINRPVEVIANAQKSIEKPQDVSPLVYYIVSQPPTPPLASATSISVAPNRYSISTRPGNYIKPAEETYVPIITSNYILPISEVQLSAPEITKSVKTISPMPSILTLHSFPPPTHITQLHYYNQQATEPRHIVYNQNSNLRYPEQSQLSVALQSQPIALVASQSSIVPSTPVAMLQSTSLPTQYGVSSVYPVNTIIKSAYTTNRPKSLNIKSVLPLIFKLLKEKIDSCSCRNECPCECKNNDIDNKLDIASGYSSLKDYGPLESGKLSLLKTVCEELQGPECIREPKNCDKIIETQDGSGETLEEEDSNEEEIDEDKED